jgi:transcription antitermination protein NusB
MRREARELALQVLFQTEFNTPVSTAEILGLFEEHVAKDIVSYAEHLVLGIEKHRTELDRQIQSVSQHWKVSRMSLVDRNILRIAVFEMKYSADPVKPGIAINEAVDIAKKYGTTDSGAFVNGVLDQVSRGL